jgi:predicted Fe-Mo cluster-binding NifX family protein
MNRTRTMKTAFAHWDNRIAPVFDTARHIHIVETESGQIVSRKQTTLSEDLPVQKTLRLVELGISTLVCGAISKPMHGLVAAYGIQVVPFVAGDLSEVIRAWLSGNLERDAFAMPGCSGRGRRRRMRGMNKEEYEMNGKGCGGTGKGGG